MPSFDHQPSHYHTSFGSHPTVLRIQDGDRVRTSTVDAMGHDRSGQQLTPRGNPLTGPFWIEGAEPGDSVAVTILSLRPNRRHGFSNASLACGVVEPTYVPQLDLSRQGRLSWEVDAEAGSARLREHLGGLRDTDWPLATMLGCIGVAPDRAQAISSSTSGPHGGNMDYRLIRPGTTVCFPVATEGALLFVGDGHAAQGAGEIVGTGIEISMDIEFSVGLRKGRPILWPRGETEEAIFTLGNARPLDQALQHATSEMMRWLRDGYGLSAEGASVLLGHFVDYDIGNVFNPAYTVACRLAKADLARMVG